MLRVTSEKFFKQNYIRSNVHLHYGFIYAFCLLDFQRGKYSDTWNIKVSYL